LRVYDLDLRTYGTSTTNTENQHISSSSSTQLGRSDVEKRLLGEVNSIDVEEGDP
jgi:hypothetical protein